MSNEERKSGLRSILSLSAVYDFSQKIMGGKRARKHVITQYVNPFLKKDTKILDIGCGTGYVLDYFTQAVDYYGYDLDPQYIAHAQKKYASRGRFFCERVNKMELKENDKFDFIIAMGLVHHLSDQESTDLFDLSKNALKKEGKLLTLDGVFYEGQSAITQYVLNNDRGKHVRSEMQYRKLASPFFNNIQSEITDKLFTIPYTACILSMSNKE